MRSAGAAAMTVFMVLWILLLPDDARADHYEEPFEATWPCPPYCESVAIGQATADIERYLSELTDARQQAEAVITGTPRAQALGFLLRRDGFYDYHLRTLRDSRDALQERAGISRPEAQMLHYGHSYVMTFHGHVMRMLKYGLRKEGNVIKVSQENRDKGEHRFLTALTNCMVCTWEPAPPATDIPDFAGIVRAARAAAETDAQAVRAEAEDNAEREIRSRQDRLLDQLSAVVDQSLAGER